jgi:hypothetical protein
MNTIVNRAALVASLFLVVVASGCASLDALSTSSQTPQGDVQQPRQTGTDPLLQEMSQESQLG